MSPDSNDARFGGGPALTPAVEEAAWAALTGEASADELDALLDEVAETPDTGLALEALADDILTLRCLGDADLRGHLAGEAAGLGDIEDNDVDAILNDSIEQLRESTSRWAGFRAWVRRPGAWGGAMLLAAAVSVFVLLPPAPEYSSTWQNGAAQMRGAPAQVGTYEHTNVAKLVVRPGPGEAFERPQVKVFVGPKGGALREPASFRAQQGTTGAVRISLPITEDMAPGTHTVVVLLGDDLSWATPDRRAWWWTRVETELEVVVDP